MTMPNPEESSYYERYRSSARRFAVVGVAGLAAGGASLAASGGGLVQALGLVVVLIGAVTLALGGSSLLPRNAVRAFARQCAQTPGREMAQGLLDAMTARKKIRMAPSSIFMVDQAVARYAQTEGTDEDLLDKLREARANNLVPKRFF